MIGACPERHTENYKGTITGLMKEFTCIE